MLTRCKLIAIDPGSEHSAAVAMDAQRGIVAICRDRNEVVRAWLGGVAADWLVCEFTPPHVMRTAAGRPYFPRQLLATAFETGRLVEAYQHSDWSLLSRREVKLALLGKVTGTDAAVRAAVMRAYGCCSATAARGTPARPGPLRGVTYDSWQAVAVGLAWFVRQPAKPKLGVLTAG